MKSLSDFLGIKEKDRPLVMKSYFLYLASGMFANALGSILRYLHDAVYGYGFSPAFQGTLSSLSQIGNFLALFLAGYLPFVIGRKNSTVTLVSCEVLGILTLVLTGNPYILMMAFVLIGIGRGTVSNITNVIVGQYAENKAAGLNILHATFAIGAVISPILMASVGGPHWRIPVTLIALLMMSAVILLQFSSLDNTRSTNKKEEMAIPRSLNFWINTFILLFYLCLEASIMSYLVSFFTYRGFFSEAFANMSASILWMMVLIGRLFCAYLSPRMNKNRLVLSLGVGLLLSFLILLETNNPALIIVGLAGTGLCLSGIYPTTLSTNERRFNSSTSATALCIGVSTIGSVVTPMVIGAVSSLHGYHNGMRVLYVPMALMLLLIILKNFVLPKPQENA